MTDGSEKKEAEPQKKKTCVHLKVWFHIWKKQN